MIHYHDTDTDITIFDKRFAGKRAVVEIDMCELCPNEGLIFGKGVLWSDTHGSYVCLDIDSFKTSYIKSRLQCKKK